MGTEILVLMMIAALVLLIVVGVPLAFATGLVATVFGFALFQETVFWIIASRTYGIVNEYALLSVPMFVFMATMMEKSGIAEDLFRAMNRLGRRLPGSLALQTLVVAVLLASMSGIIGGEIVLLGLIALPQMLKLGYDKKLAIGTVVSGGSLGTMIPPSIVLVFYGITANVSIADLFMAVVVPGLILASSYMIYIVARCVLNPDLAPRETDVPIEPRLHGFDLWRARFNLLLPIGVAASVLGSIYAGVASVTEAAAFGAAGTIVAAALRGRLTLGALFECGRTTFVTAGVLFWVTFGANALVGVFTFMNGQTVVSNFVDGLNLTPWQTIILINVILILLGMFIDWIGILLLTVPIFLPIVVGLGYDPIWFGVMFCLNMQISYLTPPFAPAAVYLKSVAPEGISLGDIFGASAPFIVLQVLNLLLMTLLPGLVLWLPSLSS